MTEYPIRAGACEWINPLMKIQYASCWACRFGSCPGGWHTWADADDREFAAERGRPDPSDQKCGCVCADGPAREDPEPEWDSLERHPCPVCGEPGPCAYDTEGRALIHATTEEDL